MSWVDFFKEKLKEIGPGILPLNTKKVRVVSLSNVDSVVASSFLVKTFEFFNYNFSVSFVKKFSDNILSEIVKDSSDIFILINPNFDHKKIQILETKNIVIIESITRVIRPLSNNLKILSLQNFEQNIKVPASSLTYLFCKELYSQISEVSYLLPIPFLENDLEIPEILLNEAIISKKLEVKKGISILVSQTLPIHKSIANTLSPFFPGVSGSEENAIALLLENEIPVRENSKFKKLEDLNEEQTKRLLTALILKRLGSEKNPDKISSNAFLLSSENDDSIIKDLRCFHYLIEACLAYSKPSLALNICLNPKYKSKAYEYINNSQISIVKSMEFFNLNKRSLTIENNEISIIKMESSLDYKFLDIFIHILNHSNFLSGKLIAVITTNPGNETLIKLQTSISKHSEILDNYLENLRKIMPFNVEVNNDSCLISCTDIDEEQLITNLQSASK